MVSPTEKQTWGNGSCDNSQLQSRYIGGENKAKCFFICARVCVPSVCWKQSRTVPTRTPLSPSVRARSLYTKWVVVRVESIHACKHPASITKFTGRVGRAELYTPNTDCKFVCYDAATAFARKDALTTVCEIPRESEQDGRRDGHDAFEAPRAAGARQEAHDHECALLRFPRSFCDRHARGASPQPSPVIHSNLPLVP